MGMSMFTWINRISVYGYGLGDSINRLSGYGHDFEKSKIGNSGMGMAGVPGTKLIPIDMID